MQTYRCRFVLASATATPWQADTLFGHLCWHLVRTRGERHLTEGFLGRYRDEDPPILLSDGFPAGYLPRPRGAALPAGREAMSKRDRVASYRAAKDLLEARWLTLDAFNAWRDGSPTAAGEQPGPAVRVVSKNAIDRLSNTAGGPGGALFDFTEHCLDAVDVYWRIADDLEPAVRDFLDDLARLGYGKRKSVGYGALASCTLEPFSGFGPVADANGFVTLSHFVPKANDPTEGFWTTRVKYGKLGEELATSPQPFKAPLIQLEAGSCFYDAPPRPWYGRLVRGLTRNPEVVQYAYAFALPMRLPAAT